MLMFDSLRGRTCLHHAAYYGHLDCLKAILSAARSSPIANSWLDSCLFSQVKCFDRPGFSCKCTYAKSIFRIMLTIILNIRIDWDIDQSKARFIGYLPKTPRFVVCNNFNCLLEAIANEAGHIFYI